MPNPFRVNPQILCLRTQGCRCAPTAGLKLANAFGVTFDLNPSVRFLLECAEPAGWLVAPRAREDSVVHHHDPDTRVAVFSSSANANDLRVTCRIDDVFSKRCVL